MPLRISLELSDRDLDHCRSVMHRARDAVRVAEDHEIVHTAREILSDLNSADAPDFITNRLPKLEALIEMAIDEDWQLPVAERTDVLAALVYFGDPDDLIPDDLPGLGFLDDAIIVELVFRELKHHIEAYRDFCHYRDTYYKRHKIGRDARTRQERLVARRASLHARMHRRHEADRHGRKQSLL
jgi:uncharacterized membrane protein YkvA (DUF1232 family)